MPEKQRPSDDVIGRQVVENVKELMAARGLSLRTLSERLDAIGRPILPTVLHRLTSGGRRVDADDLIALSIALGVNPSALLLPRHVRADDIVDLTGTVQQRASAVWPWADGRVPLPPGLVPEGTTEIVTPGDSFHDFRKHARPDTDANASEPDPVVAELMAMERMVGMVLAAGRPEVWAEWRDTILRRFRLVAIQLEELIARLDREAFKDAFQFDTASALDQLNVSVAAVRQPAVPFAPGTEERVRRAASAEPGPHAAPTTVNPLDPFGKSRQGGA